MRPDLCDAILALDPRAEFVVYGNKFKTLVWHGQDAPPDEATVMAKLDELRAAPPPPPMKTVEERLEERVAALEAKAVSAEPVTDPSK